jgi:PAS domain S-box-containing protein
MERAVRQQGSFKLASGTYVRTRQPGSVSESADQPSLLLVDDNEEGLFALKAMLKRDDVSIITARSGTEALELMLEHTIMLAIIDVQMPEIDGFELATLMRGVARTRDVPIIFVTAGSQDEQRVFAGYEAGAVDFLFKPIDAHLLRSKVGVFITLEKQRYELRRSEMRFRRLVEATSQAVWRLEPNGSVSEDSPTFRELTGISLSDWLDGGWPMMIHPDDRAQVLACWEEARNRCATYEVEYRVCRAGGGYTWTHARFAPVFDDNGRLIEWIGANTDIEARKQAENIREMFVAILSHDLRNPLGAILNSAQLVLSRTDDEQIKRPLARVLSSGGRMARMIEQLLDLTRVRLGGGIDLCPLEVDFARIVNQVLSEITTAKDRFVVDICGDTHGIWDVDRMCQVASNLAGNAVDHSPPNSPIFVRIDGGHADRLEFSVHNVGSAIPKEIRDVIFEPFRGVKDRRRGQSGGIGLGLFITKQLVEAHGGSLRFDTSDDTGTVFRVRLPRYTRTVAK